MNSNMYILDFNWSDWSGLRDITGFGQTAF